MVSQDKSPYLTTYTEILRDIFTRLIQKYNKFQLSKDPEIQKRDLVEYNKKMRVSALEKFNAPGYLSVTNYFLTQKDKETKHAVGALIFYVIESNLKKLFEGLGIAVAGFDDDDPEQVTAKCNQLCQMISDEFRNEIKAKYNKELIPSEPFSIRNTIPEGIDFSYNQYEKCEVSFEIKNVKSFNIEITLIPLGK